MGNREDDILVSVICLTYNHGLYVKSALDGFLLQKTNFKFEIIIHDDASTDNTQAIIKEYADKYPNIFVPILQTENQHQKKVGIFKNYILQIARGKYFALCEGDDYWTDENKLQMQVDFLETHPDYVMTCHNSIRHYCKSGDDIAENPFKCEGEIKPDDIIYHSNDSFPATASIVYRAYIRREYPVYAKMCPTGDYLLRVLCVSRGKVYYFDRIMSVYRYGAIGSWTLGMKNSVEKHIKYNERMMGFLKTFNENTQMRYNNAVQKSLERIEFGQCLLENDKKGLNNSAFYLNLSKFMQLKIKIVMTFPFFRTVWHKYIKHD